VVGKIIVDFMASYGQSAVAVYPVTNYNFGQKDNKVDKDAQDKFQRMQHKWGRCLVLNVSTPLPSHVRPQIDI